MVVVHVLLSLSGGPVLLRLTLNRSNQLTLNVPTFIARTVISMYTVKKEIKQAQSRKAAAKTLTVLATNKDSDVRYFVARNPRTPYAALATLAKDTKIAIRRQVAKNPSTPSETLAALAAYSDCDIQRGIATNPNAPGDVLTA